MSKRREARQDLSESMMKNKKDEEWKKDDEAPLQGLLLSPHTVLDEAHRTGRLKCQSCSSSRLLYCYTCCCLVGLDPQLVPRLKLPVKIDIIKHPNETDGKSTAVHAKLLAPDDVSIYTYPCIPELDTHTHNVVLVFPGPGSMTVEDLADSIRTSGRKPEGREAKRPRLNETYTHTLTHTPKNREHVCPIQRVIFIDSTWNQTTKIITDERLQELPRVELKSRRTCFWRHQRGYPDSYLSTIEAVYYFLMDFHTHCLQREYCGEYDNLLFFYCFLHKLITNAKQRRV